MLSLVRVSEEEMGKGWILSPDSIKRLLPMNRAVAVMNYKTTLFLSFVLNGVGYPFSVKCENGREKEHIHVGQL